MAEPAREPIPIFTVEMSLNAATYVEGATGSVQVVIDVFANSRDEAMELARMTLRHPDQFDIDGVTEN